MKQNMLYENIVLDMNGKLLLQKKTVLAAGANRITLM
jgi:hypothetical protein